MSLETILTHSITTFSCFKCSSKELCRSIMHSPLCIGFRYFCLFLLGTAIFPFSLPFFPSSSPSFFFFLVLFPSNAISYLKTGLLVLNMDLQTTASLVVASYCCSPNLCTPQFLALYSVLDNPRTLLFSVTLRHYLLFKNQK